MMVEMDPSEKVEEGWINVRFIVEAQGKPESHVLNNLKAVKSQIASIKGVEIYDETQEDPQKISDQIFSALLDLGLVVEDVELLMQLVLRYGPSAVLVIEPETIELEFRQLQNVINDVTVFLHKLSQQNLKLRVQNYNLSKKDATEE